MSERESVTVVNRRTLLIAGGSAAACLALAPLLARAAGETSVAPKRTRHFEEEFKRLLAGATPVEGGVTLELPEIAENGNFVPVTISVDSPMTDADHVKTIHLLSSGNPVAAVATFNLAPINAVAKVQSRMRLARTQDVIVIAEHSSGALHIATMAVKVTIGGCSS